MNTKIDVARPHLRLWPIDWGVTAEAAPEWLLSLECRPAEALPGLLLTAAHARTSTCENPYPD